MNFFDFGDDMINLKIFSVLYPGTVDVEVVIQDKLR